MSHRKKVLWEVVCDLRRDGLIDRKWRVPDLRENIPPGEVNDKDLATRPANTRVDKDGTDAGDSVKKGNTPRTWRWERGLYSLIKDPADDMATQRTELARANAVLKRLGYREG